MAVGALCALMAGGLVWLADTLAGPLVSTSPIASAPIASRAVSLEKSDPSDEILAFLESCKQGVDVWRGGQLNYPKDMKLDMGETRLYVAAVDIRSTPAPPDDVLPIQAGESSPVAVQCAVAARLTAQGDGVRVDEPDWVLRTFTPTRLINWSWSVTGLKPQENDLKLDVQPAVKVGNGIMLVSNAEPAVSSYVTTADVAGTWIQDFGQWWSDSWPIITPIAGAIAAALVAVTKWGGEIGQATRDAVAGWRRASDQRVTSKRRRKRGN